METSYSGVGKAILALKNEITDTFLERVRKSIENAKNLKDPILINTMPAYVEALAKVLSKDHMISGLEQSENIADEHGGERARLSHYEPSDLIQEYQIFRLVVFEILDRNGVGLFKKDIIAINHFIDTSVRNSVSSYELVQGKIREQFVATLTHDLRNPLSAANMAAELIIDELENPKEIIFLVSRIKENITRVNRMIQDLLDSALVRGGERLKLNLSEVNGRDLIQGLTRELSLVHGRRFIVEVEPVKGIWDKEALGRALENLASNAIKYGDPNKPITIRGMVKYERFIVDIHNWGNPIPVEEQESIFQVFMRTQAAKNSSQRGWGLGLPLVRAVAESHGGSIGVTSNLEEGTTFVFDIPTDSRPYQDKPVTS
jgi:signal transduction histidine kinase